MITKLAIMVILAFELFDHWSLVMILAHRLFGG